MNHVMIFMWKIGMGKLINSWPSVAGRIMVIRHRGRRSGRDYLTPVNYVQMEDEVYCMAGFGPGTDWYRNLLADPVVQLWLPEGRRGARATDASGSPRRPELLRQLLIASGAAGPLMGIDQKKLTDEQLAVVAKDYRLVQFQLEA
jgi:deazaflavin-dependent oxidoreductase (nitroreductase family)